MKSSVITFPGSNCDRDMDVALKKFGFRNKMVWHDDVELPKSDLVVLPGGFSYGDYLRCGSMASKSKIMKSVINFANSGGMVMGICNGFQILGGSGTGTNIAMGSGVDTVLEGETYIVLSKLNSSNSQIRIDGHFKNTGNIGTNHLNSIKLGGNAIGGSNLEGYIAEFIIFSDIGEQENIEGYLAHKWGLTSKLPADHTHKNNLAF